MATVAIAARVDPVFVSQTFDKVSSLQERARLDRSKRLRERN
jgi:hypothetical protein